MSDRELLVIDAYDLAALTRHTQSGAWDVLLLGLSEAWFRWQEPSLPPSDDRRRFVDATPFIDEIHESVASFVLGAIGALPDADVGDQPLWKWLQAKHGTAWWYTETSEKGPYRTRSCGGCPRQATIGA